MQMGCTYKLKVDYKSQERTDGNVTFALQDKQKIYPRVVIFQVRSNKRWGLLTMVLAVVGNLFNSAL